VDAALDALDRRSRGLLDTLLEVLRFLGMPDRVHVAKERALAELHRRAAISERAGDDQEQQEANHTWSVAAAVIRSSVSRSRTQHADSSPRPPRCAADRAA